MEAELSQAVEQTDVWTDSHAESEPGMMKLIVVFTLFKLFFKDYTGVYKMIQFVNKAYLLFKFSVSIDLCGALNHRLPIN